MTPYYDQGGVTIYNDDCAEVLPSVDPSTVDLVLTDPPYGINYSPGYLAPSNDGGPLIAGDDAPFDPASLLVFGRCVLWGANYYAHHLPPGGWIIWSKVQDNRFQNAGRIHSTRSFAEVAWTNVHNHVDLFNHFWASYLHRASERKTSHHPAQKPVALMRWILDRTTEPGDLVLDPFMGSGPVAQACADLGRRYIGVELEEDYCRIAVERLRQGTFDFGESA